MRIHGTHFIFIFGGYSVEEGKAVSSLIAVDVDHLEWWYVEVEGGRVAGRIHPVVVAIDQRIFIFSGYGRFSKPDPRSFRSYSIAAYQPALRRWTWEARDVSYPGSIPPNQVFGAGIAVYGGKKIMLVPGKLYYQDKARKSYFIAKVSLLTYIAILAIKFRRTENILFSYRTQTVPDDSPLGRLS
jgi:hypothetical protein